jgi:hypothetical protein
MRSERRTPAGQSAAPDSHRCLTRHLALALEELARSAPSPRAARCAAAAARLRDLADAPAWAGNGLAVSAADGSYVRLVELLADAWAALRRSDPAGGHDGEMLDAARQLVEGLHWHLPG